jgi:RNA 2',3'-cyclic 3'-phosphodiesterase
VRGQLAAQLAPYRAHLGEARWTHPRSWHLTLLFLGQVRSERVLEVQALVDEAAAAVAPYHVRADEGDGRLYRGEGVGWLELSQGAGALIELAVALAERCPPAMTAGAPPRRTPSAHLTLARKAGRATIDALRSQAYGPLEVAWRVDRIWLLRSHLDATGARYETLHEATM